MAKNRLLGIEIGTKHIKMAVCEQGQVLQTAMMEVSDSLLQNDKIIDYDRISALLTTMMQTNGIREKECAVVIPDSLVISRNTVMAAMTDEQLRLNLPFEFRDFISGDPTGYNYDYAVKQIERDANGRAVRMHIQAVAALKELVYDVAEMCTDAGLKPVIIIPKSACLNNLLTIHERKPDVSSGQEYCIVDIGFTATNLYIFRDGNFEVSKRIEYGCAAVERAVQTAYQLDEYKAHDYVVNNEMLCHDHADCRSIYDIIAVEVMRAVNFYSFNVQNSNLKEAYFTGGGSLIKPLAERIVESSGLTYHNITELYPNCMTEKNLEFIPAVIGATYQD